MPSSTVLADSKLRRPEGIAHPDQRQNSQSLTRSHSMYLVAGLYRRLIAEWLQGGRCAASEGHPLLQGRWRGEAARQHRSRFLVSSSNAHHNLDV